MMAKDLLLMVVITCLNASAVGAASQKAVPFDLQNWIDQAIQAGHKRLVIPPGSYRVTPKRRQHLVLHKLEDIEIIANQVEMICTQTTRALTVSQCRNVILRGLTIDYDPLPFTQGCITAIADNNTVHDVTLFDGYPRAEQVRDFKYEIFRPDTRTLRFGSYHDFCVEKLTPKRIRVKRGGRYQGEKVGDIIVIGSEYAPDGQIPHALYITDSQQVVLEDVTLYASNCFGFFETGCRRTVYRRCRIDRRDPKDDLKSRADPRIRSLNADAFHSKHALIGPQILACRARFQGDDCINICGDYHMVMHSQGNKLRILAKGHLNIEAGDPLEVVQYDGRRLPDARAVSCQRIGSITGDELAFMAQQRMHRPFKEGSLREIHEVVLDRAIPLARGSIIAAANRMGNGFRVEGCRFGFNRSRGILIKASHGQVQDNQLEGCWGEAIKVAPEYWWLEAGSSQDLRITGNRIRDCLGDGIAVYAGAGAGGMALAGAHKDIFIQDNVLSHVQGVDLWVSSTRGLTLKNNRFSPGEPEVKLEHCEALDTDLPEHLLQSYSGRN
jgi:hypothetical protein